MPTFKNLQRFGLLIAFLAPALAQARPHGPGPGGPEDGPPPSAEHEERMLQHMQKDLNLTADQTQQMKAIHEKYRAKLEALRGKIDPLHKQLMEKLSSDAANRSEVEQLMRSLAALRVDMQLLQFDRHQEVTSLLTPEQKAKWREKMEHRRKDFRDKMQKNRDRDPDDRD